MIVLVGLLVQACLFTFVTSQCQRNSEQECDEDSSDTEVLLQSLVRQNEIEEEMSVKKSFVGWAAASPDLAMLSSPSFTSILPACQCQATVSTNDHSSGCCRRGGETGWGTSQLYQLQNAVFDSGTLRLLGNSEDAGTIQDCFNQCDVTWFGVAGPLADAVMGDDEDDAAGAQGSAPSAGLISESSDIDMKHSVIERRSSTTSQEQIQDMLHDVNRSLPSGVSLLRTGAKCSDVEWSDLAVVVSRQWEHNFYHETMDSLFTTFLTASLLSLEMGCSSQDVQILTATRKTSRFDALWQQLFGKPLQFIGDVTGCYKNVVYGSLFHQRWVHGEGWPYPNIDTKVFRSQAIVPWAMAFSANLRASIPAVSGFTPSKSMVLIHHLRMPRWIWYYKWEDLDIGDGVSIKRHHMGRMSLNDQMRVVSSSDGIISATGAGFTHQVFLPTFSLLYIMSPVDAATCEIAIPATWHDTPSLHMGHTSLHWRTCGGPEEFAKTDQVSMLQFLKQRRATAKRQHESSACYIFGGSAAVGDSTPPRCHKELSMKLSQAPQKRCGGRYVGEPLLPTDAWSVDDVQ